MAVVWLGSRRGWQAEEVVVVRGEKEQEAIGQLLGGAEAGKSPAQKEGRRGDGEAV